MEYYELFQLSEEIKRLYDKGEITNITPLWVTDKKKIDFTKQNDGANSRLLADGFIIQWVNIEKLLSNFNQAETKMYRKKKMFNEQQESQKIGQIIYHWRNQVSLIPPTIFSSTDGQGGFLFAQDGKHRLNVAYCAGVEEIPILVLKTQLEKIKRILNLL